jgi:predicted RNase H-like HicB family nuclease
MKIDVRLYQDEDGVWIAEVPSIPGCGSDGRTREEAMTNVRDAISLCLQVRSDLNLPVQVETVTMDFPSL